MGKKRCCSILFIPFSQARDEGSTYIQDVWVCVCVCALYTHTHTHHLYKSCRGGGVVLCRLSACPACALFLFRRIKKKKKQKSQKVGQPKEKEEEKNRRVFPRHPGVMMLTHIFFLQTAPLWEYQVGLCLCRSQLRYSIDHQLFLRWATNPPFLPLLAIFSCID